MCVNLKAGKTLHFGYSISASICSEKRKLKLIIYVATREYIFLLDTHKDRHFFKIMTFGDDF